MSVPVPPDRAHQLALLFVSVLEPPLAPAERQMALGLACKWVPTLSEGTAAALMDVAEQAHRSSLAPPLDALAGDLCESLTHDECTRLLADLGRLANADGRLTRGEAEGIRRVRSVMNPRDPSA